MASTPSKPAPELADLQRTLAGDDASSEPPPAAEDVARQMMELERTRGTGWALMMIVLAVAPFGLLWWVSGSWTFALIILGVAVAVLVVWLGLLKAAGRM